MATTTGSATLGGSSSVGAAPTNNFSSDAAQNIDATKLAALQAIAQSGSQQQAGLALAGQQQAAARTQALKTAMAFSAAHGGAFNPAVQQNTQAQVAAPFDSRQAATNMIANNFKQANDATSNAYGGYFNLAKAGLPVADAALHQTINNDQLAAAQKAVTDRLTAMRDQVALAKLNGTTAPTTAQAISNLGGESNAGNVINSEAQQESKTGTDINGWSARTGGSGTNQVGTPGTVSAENGLNPTVGTQLASAAAQNLATAAAKAQNAPPTVAQIRNDPGYPRALQHAQDILNGKVRGVPKGNEVAAVNQLVKEGMPPGSAYQIVADASGRTIQAQSLPAGQ